MSGTLYIKKTGSPFPDREYSLEIRRFDGVEVDWTFITYLNQAKVLDLISLNKIGSLTLWGYDENYESLAKKCEFCGEVKASPCKDFEFIKHRSKYETLLCNKEYKKYMALKAMESLNEK